MLSNELIQIILEYLNDMTRNKLYNSSKFYYNRRELCCVKIINKKIGNYNFLTQTVATNDKNYDTLELTINSPNVHYWPPSVKRLNVSYNTLIYDNAILVFPITIKEITIKGITNIDLNFGRFEKMSIISGRNLNIKRLPPGLIELKIISLKTTLNKLPSFLKRLTFMCKNIKLSLFKNFQDLLGDKLEHLAMYQNTKIDKLPSSLKHITFYGECNYKFENLPSIIKLSLNSLGTSFYQKLDNLPQSLKILKLDINYAYELNNLPDLEQLIFEPHASYKLPLRNLPNTLKVLVAPVTNIMFPPLLKKLVVPYCDNVPLSLEYLEFTNCQEFQKYSIPIVKLSSINIDYNDFFKTDGFYKIEKIKFVNGIVTECNISCDSDIEFNEGLLKLKLTNWKKSVIKTPNSLKSLIIIAGYCTVHLTNNLKFLQIGGNTPILPFIPNNLLRYVTRYGPVLPAKFIKIQ